jgi:hypothetical protein
MGTRCTIRQTREGILSHCIHSERASEQASEQVASTRGRLVTLTRHSSNDQPIHVIGYCSIMTEAVIAIECMQFVLQAIGFNAEESGGIMEAGLSEFEDLLSSPLLKRISRIWRNSNLVSTLKLKGILLSVS